MEQFIQRKLVCKKSLKIDEDALKELDNLYAKIGTTAEYSIITEDNIHYSFDNLEELLQHDFSKEIKILKISRHDYTRKANLDIKFEIDYLSTFTTYDTIAEISYSTSDEDIDIILKQKILEFYKKYATHNWIVGKIGIFGYSAILLFLMLAIVVVIASVNKINVSIPITMNFFMRLIISSIMWILIKKFDILICKRFLKPIVYYINKQKDKWDRTQNIKSNIFWGVIVAIIVGIFTTIICNIILKE